MQFMSMDERKTVRVYDVWSGLYDRTFGAMTRTRQRVALKHLPLRETDRVLDIGVGTGAALRWYPPGVQVVGLDLSRGMLKRAARMRNQTGVRGWCLVQADAMRPPFADASFDHIMISHTISVVTDPGAVLSWAARLVRPAGRVIIVNHFRSSHRVTGTLSRALNPLCMRMGWRSDVSLESLLEACPLQHEYSFKVLPADLWKIIVLRRPLGVLPLEAQSVDPQPADAQLVTNRSDTIS
jgi:phosphatidylethanolamine/phosphatidyl-N-methylethanolamine N-methyltransferase